MSIDLKGKTMAYVYRIVPQREIDIEAVLLTKIHLGRFTKVPTNIDPFAGWMLMMIFNRVRLVT